jgi:hypothetical protein
MADLVEIKQEKLPKKLRYFFANCVGFFIILFMKKREDYFNEHGISI